MAKFRKVYSTFWDSEFIESLSPEDKYFYLFLITNPLANECGIYQITKKKIGYYMGYNLEAIENLIKRFEGYGKIIYNQETSEILIVDYLIRPDKVGEPMLDCIISELKKVKEPALVQAALMNITSGEMMRVKTKFS